jgi:hypothetical protein
MSCPAKTKMVRVGALARALVACFVLLAGVAANRAEATPTLLAGDEIWFTAIEGDFPNPRPGAAFPVELIVGSFSGSGDLFHVEQLKVFNQAGQCISCDWQLDLANFFVSENDLEPSGTLTGTFSSGVTVEATVSHTTLTWERPAPGPDYRTLSGIIDPPELVAVPEPSSLTLLGTAFFSLALLLRRRRFRP